MCSQRTRLLKSSFPTARKCPKPTWCRASSSAALTGTLLPWSCCFGMACWQYVIRHAVCLDAHVVRADEPPVLASVAIAHCIFVCGLRFRSHVVHRYIIGPAHVAHLSVGVKDRCRCLHLRCQTQRTHTSCSESCRLVTLQPCHLPLLLAFPCHFQITPSTLAHHFSCTQAGSS